MSELRKDPVTEEWAIIAGRRSGRPRDYARSLEHSDVPAYVEQCPFCPGNEDLTPPAVLEIPDPRDGRRWQVRGVPNKFPALEPTPTPLAESDGPLFAATPGRGAHEVIVETPVHNGFPVHRSEEEMKLLVRAYQKRYLALMDDPAIQYVLVFKNQGEGAGTSLEHPHSQIVASPVVSASVRRRGDIAREHYRRSGQCLYCQIAAEEVRVGKRVVYSGQGCVVFHPFAAAHVAETWIVPLKHEPSFGPTDEKGLTEFASVLLMTLRQLYWGFGDPDFNYAIHSAPRDEEHAPHRHWYLQITPRLTKTAGFEVGSGIYINVAPPEETAEAMRSALPRGT